MPNINIINGTLAIQNLTSIMRLWLPYRDNQNTSNLGFNAYLSHFFYANEVECIKAQARDTLLGAEVQALMGIIR